MSEDRVKNGPAVPLTALGRNDPGTRRTSRSSEKSAEGTPPMIPAGQQKKGKESAFSQNTTGTRSHDTQGSEPYDAKFPEVAYDPRSPAAVYDARSPQTPRDARSPQTPRDARSPQTPRDARSPQTPRDARSPQTPQDARSSPAAPDSRSSPAAFDARSSPVAFDARSSPAGHDARSSPVAHDARSSPVAHDARSSPVAHDSRSSPVGFDGRSSPDAYDRSPAADSRGVPYDGRPSGSPGRLSEAEAEGPPEGPPQPEPGTRRSTVTSAQPAGAASIAEDGTANPNDAYNAEFSYYCAVLRTYAPSLSREYDKATTRLWMRKLFGPEYHPTVLKPKRNKYLLYLSITIYNDEAYGIFKQEPPCGKLPEITDIPFDRDFPPAAWETEVQWTDTLNELPDELKMSECYLHDRDACPAPDEKLAGTLDAQFQFFLWLAKPYVTLLPDPEEKTTAACWIRLLCGVASQREDCVALKEIRNDYMQALLGYVHDLRVEGPFRLMPPAGPLPPLALLYEDCVEDNGFADPGGNQAQEFLSIQRLPESGAFAYINVTGELFGNL